MATFLIRRNHPYAGSVALCKVAGGGFAAKEMFVTEPQFVAAVVVYLKQMSSAEKSKLLRSAPPAVIPPQSGEHKPFRVRKATTTAAAS
jgi:hypothetical protein